jgi:hypothetical protein
MSKTLHTLAAESKAAWDAHDFKTASRALQEAKETFPEEVLSQGGDGTVLRKGDKGTFEPVA